MTEAEWLACDDVAEALDQLEPAQLISQRKLRLFEVASCRRFTAQCPEPRLIRSLDLAEMFADGRASSVDLSEVHEESRDIEDESALNEEDVPEIDALYYGAMAIREATSPNHPDYHSGTPALVDHLISATAYLPKHSQDEESGQHAREIHGEGDVEKLAIAVLLRDIFGNPFRPVAFSPEWRPSTIVALAQGMYESRDFDAMPILADALQDAGCDSDEFLTHCRGSGPHVRGCWVVDLVLGKG